MNIPRIHAPKAATAAALGLTILGLAFRLHDIGRESLWLDEGYTLLFSRLNFPHLIHVGGDHEQPPLYYLLIHSILSLRHGYLTPRFVSAIAGTLSIYVLYLLGKRLFSPLAGLIAALLLAVSPAHLWYSQDGRAYELLSLLIGLSYLCLFVWLDKRRTRYLVMYGVVTLLALYTHYTAVFVLAPQMLLALRTARGERSHRRPLILSWIVVALAYAPWLGVLARNAGTVMQGYWIPQPTWHDIASTSLEFLGLQTACPTGITCATHTLAAGLHPTRDPIIAVCVIGAMLIGLVLAGVAYAVRPDSLTVLVVVLWLVEPFLALLAISFYRPLFLDRYILGITPPLLLLIGYGCAQAWQHRRLLPPAAAGLLLLLGANVVEVRATQLTDSTPDWRAPARDLRAAYRPGQGVAYYPGVVRVLIKPYLPRGWRPTAQRSIWLHTYLDVPGWTKRYGSLTDYQLRDLQIRQLSSGLRQVWVVQQEYAGTWDVWHWFTVHGFHMLVDERYAGGTYLQLWDREPPEALGPADLPRHSGWSNWSTRGNVSIRGGLLTEEGAAVATRVFSVAAGATYTVDSVHRTATSTEPVISATLYQSCRTGGGGTWQPNGRPVARFPRLLHYDLWANGTWIEKPFGFVASPGARCVVLRLRSIQGKTEWRDVSMFHEAAREHEVTVPTQ